MFPQPFSPARQAGAMAARLQPKVAFLGLILGALVAFELFNFSTTEHALVDLLGGEAALGVPWSLLLALAFCGIDFAGIARLFIAEGGTPDGSRSNEREALYLFLAWLLAATINAVLTWWGVALAVTANPQRTTVMDAEMVLLVVPVFVAVLVWVIRILIIGTLSIALAQVMKGSVAPTAPLPPAEPAAPPEWHTVGSRYPSMQPAARSASGRRRG